VRCAIKVQNGMIERIAGVPPERRTQFRVGIHVGDVGRGRAGCCDAVARDRRGGCKPFDRAL